MHQDWISSAYCKARCKGVVCRHKLQLLSRHCDAHLSLVVDVVLFAHVLVAAKHGLV